MEPERVIVDASNVAHATEGVACLANVRLVRDRLTEEGLTPILVADAALRHQIDDAPSYEGLVKAGEIKQAPAGTDADYFILSFARELGASVLSSSVPSMSSSTASTTPAALCSRALGVSAGRPVNALSASRGARARPRRRRSCSG